MREEGGEGSRTATMGRGPGVNGEAVVKVAKANRIPQMRERVQVSMVAEVRRYSVVQGCASCCSLKLR